MKPLKQPQHPSPAGATRKPCGLGTFHLGVPVVLDKPVYSPDGSKVLVVSAPRSERLFSEEPNQNNIDEVLGWIPAEGGAFTTITHKYFEHQIGDEKRPPL